MQHGFLNVLKPPGMTSHDVVSFLRRIYGQKKIGHAGTLDPAAAGVLPVALGQATRLLEYMTDAGKSYRAELTFGYETDSGDDTGNITKTAAFTMPDREQIDRVLQTFCGAISQTPPMHSAIKVNGTKLYELARQGLTIEVPERMVFIHSIVRRCIRQEQMLFDVDCSKGTYIRTLCRDIGRQLGILAVMSFLIRTRVGDFALQDAITLEQLQTAPLKYLLPLDSVLQHLPIIQLDAKQSLAFRQGQKIAYKSLLAAATNLRIYDSVNELIGIGQYNADASCLGVAKVIAR